MDFKAWQDLISLVASVLGIVMFVGTFIVFALRRILVRSWITRVIFLGGFLATSAVLTGIVIAFLPVFARVSGHVTLGTISVSNIALGDGIAVLGLIFGIASWFASLWVALGTRRWVVLGVMGVAGALIYAGAVFYNDFSSYLLVGAVPSLFGLFGPEKPST